MNHEHCDNHNKKVGPLDMPCCHTEPARNQEPSPKFFHFINYQKRNN